MSTEQAESTVQKIEKTIKNIENQQSCLKYPLKYVCEKMYFSNLKHSAKIHILLLTEAHLRVGGLLVGVPCSSGGGGVTPVCCGGDTPDQYSISE